MRAATTAGRTAVPRRGIWVLAWVLGSFAVPAHAQEPEVTPEPAQVEQGESDGVEGGVAADPTSEVAEPTHRVAVLVLAADSADAEVADGITEVLIGDLAASDSAPGSIIGKEELQAQLGHTELGSMDCVSSPTCLGRVGVQLEVDEVLAGTIRRHGDEEGWRFDLQRIDIRSGESVARVFEQVTGDMGDLAGAMQVALHRLYAPIEEVAVLTLVPQVLGAVCDVDGEARTYEGSPLRFELSAGAHEVRVRKEGYIGWRRTLVLEAGTTLQLEPGLARIPASEPSDPSGPTPIAPDPSTGISPWLWAGVGTTAVGGALALGFGISSRRTPSGGNRVAALEFADDRRRDAWVTNISLGVMAAGAVISTIGLIRSDFRDAPVDVAVVPAGASVTARGQF